MDELIRHIQSEIAMVYVLFVNVIEFVDETKRGIILKLEK